MSDPVELRKRDDVIVEAGALWVSQLKVHEIEIKRSNGCFPTDVFVPTRETLFKYGDIRGQIGPFYGTWKNVYRPNFLGLPWSGYGPHFYPDRATFFDRNYNRSLADEAGLFVGIINGVRKRKPISIVVGVGIYGAATRDAGTLRFDVCDD